MQASRAGIRWRDVCCVFLASRAALEPLLSGVEAFVRWCPARPFVMLWRAVLRPFAECGFGAFSACAYGAQRRPCEKKPGGQKERLQNSGRVLYNSK